MGELEAESREQKHITLMVAIDRLESAVIGAQNLLHEITPPRPVEPLHANPVPLDKPIVEVKNPSFQEVYDNAPQRINHQAAKLDKSIIELREVLL